MGCGVFADGATAPTADQVYANTGTGDAAVGATNGPVVAVVTAAKNGAGVSVNAAVTGLTANTAYDIYCATNDGTKVLSDKVDFTTTKVVAADPSFSPASGNVTTGSALTLTSANAATICMRSGTTAPTCNADGTCGTGSTAYNATAKPTITAAITWKAIGCAGTGKTDSAVVTAAYDAVAAHHGRPNPNHHGLRCFFGSRLVDYVDCVCHCHGSLLYALNIVNGNGARDIAG